MSMFKEAQLTSEDAFWVMFYCLKEHYDLSGGTFDVSDILSASEPILYKNGLQDWEATKRGVIEDDDILYPADLGMISFWNDAVEQYKKEGIPPLKTLRPMDEKEQTGRTSHLRGFVNRSIDFLRGHLT